MNKHLKLELLSNLSKIKNKLQRQVISEAELVATIEQLKGQIDTASISFICESINVIEKYSRKKDPSKGKLFFAVPKIPFDEIFALLKDGFQGKLNEHLQEILNSAEIELIINKKEPDNPASARQLQIKINLTAAVIDKYADLLSMIIGAKSDEKNDEILQQSYKIIKELNDKLERVNLISSLVHLKSDYRILLEEYQSSSGCFLFLNTSIKKQLSTIEKIIDDLMRPDLSSVEIIGGILLLDRKIIDIVSNKKIKADLHTSIVQLLEHNHFSVTEEEMVNRIIWSYINRAKFIDIKWPAPFSIETVTVLSHTV